MKENILIKNLKNFDKSNTLYRMVIFSTSNSGQKWAIQIGSRIFEMEYCTFYYTFGLHAKKKKLLSKIFLLKISSLILKWS